MSAPTRMAGWGNAADGSVITWTVSDGRKGRRWREVVARGTEVIHALLLETDPDGTFSHLELARADGLWTFHPEGDGTLHGNHVDRSEAGVQHVEGWSFHPDDVLVVDGSPISLAAVGHRLAGLVEIGGSVVVVAIVLDQVGGLRREDALGIERLSQTRWQVGDWPAIDVDELGLPVLDAQQRRPLEVSRPAPWKACGQRPRKAPHSRETRG